MKEYLFFQNHKKHLPKDNKPTPQEMSQTMGSPGKSTMGKTGMDFKQMFIQQKE